MHENKYKSKCCGLLGGERGGKDREGMFFKKSDNK